jgi:hypothetical protein
MSKRRNKMAKKSFMVLVLAVVIVGGTYALPEFRFGMGGGGYLMGEMGGGVEASYGSQSYSIEYNNFGGGGFVFLDLTFVELSLGYFKTAVFNIRENLNGNLTGNSMDLNATGLDIGLFIKYPFGINKKLLLFPLLGANYRHMLSVQDEDNRRVDGIGDFSSIWFKLGGGLDFSFTNNLFLRGEFIYGVRLSNEFESDLIDDMRKPGSEFSNPSIGIKPTLGHGPQPKIAIGFRI